MWLWYSTCIALEKKDYTSNAFNILIVTNVAADLLIGMSFVRRIGVVIKYNDDFVEAKVSMLNYFLLYIDPQTWYT